MKDVQTITSLHLSIAHRAQLIEHARREHPNECCGLLLGSTHKGGANVERILPAANIANGDRRTRFQVDWGTLLDAYRLARAERLEVLGSYHSHPDGRARPSRVDERDASPGHVYVIIGSPLACEPECSAWVLSPMRRFVGIDALIRADRAVRRQVRCR